MNDLAYERRRGEIELTSTEQPPMPGTTDLVGTGQRHPRDGTSGPNLTRSTRCSWLPADLQGLRILDAGCGTGALAVEAARRGAEVVAIDLSPTLVQLARERMPHDLGTGQITFCSGDMLDSGLGHFDHVVGMDSLIHYERHDVVRAIGTLRAPNPRSIVFTFAPRTPLLAAMRLVGRLLPRSDRSPSIVPVAENLLRKELIEQMPGWTIGRDLRVSTSFYKSHSIELCAPGTGQA
jgi:magnesium-protoporphyrin O-methyltransferase